ncbi:MAG: VanZ family protein [Clostridia bacterium]|nr:VanZ family protein [Clostridia bacterium]
MKKRLVREFNFWRFLGILALICTMFMVWLLCYEALKPGEDSSETSGEVEETIKDIIPDIPDNDQNFELVSIRCKQANASRAIGTKLTLTFAYTPSQATDKALTFSSSDASIASVDEKGVVTFNSYGECKITATSVAKPNIKTTFKVICSGVAAGDISNIYPTFSDEPNAPAKYEVPEGTYSYICFRDAQGQVVSVDTLKIVCHDSTILRMSDTKHFVAIKPGTANITVTNTKTKQTKDINITVTESDTFDAPELFEFEEHVLYVNTNTSFNPRDNISSILPEGATLDKRFCTITCTNKSLFEIAGETYTAVSVGEACFVFTPYASVETSFYRVVVVEPLPEQLTIMGRDRIICDKEYQYTVFDGERDCDKISWSVVKGKGVTITEEGKLIATELGDVIIRATSTQDESIYADFRVRVSPYENFHTYVRKIFGHFTAFAILGVGFAVTYFLLFGRARKISPIVALISSAVVAAITEILQMPIFTQNRGPSVKDVVLDTEGSAWGVLGAVVFILLFLLVVRLISKRKYEQIKLAISRLSFGTMFKRAKKVFADIPEEPKADQSNQPQGKKQSKQPQNKQQQSKQSQNKGKNKR